MRWQGLLTATPIAAAILALAELTRLPARAHGGDPSRLLAALAHLIESAIAQFAIPGALLVLAAMVVLAIERRGPSQLLFGLLGAVSVALVGHARLVLAAYPPFEWVLPANVGFVVLAVGIGGVLLWTATGSPRRLASLFGAALAAASLIVARSHYTVFVGSYPPMHACALELSFIGLTLGLALLATALPKPAIARGAAIASVLLAVLTFVPLPASAWARPYVIAYTELGRSADVARALTREREHLLPTALPRARTSPLLAADGEAEPRFAARSGLPSLDVDLADYDVLVVLSDATRWDRTSLARGRSGPTPTLASLERRGAHVMTRAYAPSNGTFPSLASMLAMTPVSFSELDVRARFWRGRLRAERTTAVEAMRASGRATFWVGHDHQECFSEHVRGLEQGFQRRELVHQALGADADADRRIADRAIDAIRAHRGSRRFFGLVFFASPHDDYQAHYPDRPSETELDRYDQELAFMDEQLGRVLAELDLERTIVVFAGDHGEAFGEHGHRFHLTSLHEEQIHVPLVVWIGGARGARSDVPTSTAYVLPWLLLRGSEVEQRAARQVLRDDVGPMMRALDGAVLSEMIGPEMQEAAFVWAEHTVLYDVLADLVRIYDARDVLQENDLREARPDLLERFTPIARRYREMRYGGRRFRFVDPLP
jgi:arylsulfatase A-like enzyme